MAELTRVVLVDDHAMVREALAQAIQEQGHVEVVAQAGNRLEAVQAVDRTNPDVLLLDYNIPGGGALAVIEHVGTHHPDVRILILTVHESPHYAVRSLEAGAHGFIVKSSAMRELAEAIAQVSAGRVYVTPALAPQVIGELSTRRGDRTGLSALSPREFELLRLLGSGCGLQEAARAQSISTSTASTYRARLMEKLGLSSTADLIRFAIENEVV